MKNVKWVLGAGWILGAVQGCGSTEHDTAAEPTGPAEFSSSLPGDKVLESLSADEVQAVCHDTSAYVSQSGLQADACKVVSVFAAAFTAAFTPETSDAELRSVCSETYEACAKDEEADDETCDAGEVAENCAASVSEYGACLEESIREFHELAQVLPSCDTLTSAALSEESSSGATFGGLGTACEAYYAKCPGISQAAEDFVDAYCGRVEPCCSEAGLGDDCRTLTIQAVQDQRFNADLAEACLARLEQYQAGPDYCGEVGRRSYGFSWVAVIPECEGVFSGGTDTAGVEVGGACDWDEDCAAPETGMVRCMATDSFFDRICVPVTQGEVGDPCLGTVAEEDGGTSTESVGAATVDGGALCYRRDNLRCDPETGTCLGARAVGEACETTVECASDAYCAPSGLCAPQLTEGAACDDYSGECAGGGDCDDTTHQCILPLAGGASCSTFSDCASVNCVDGVCAHPLAPLCGER